MLDRARPRAVQLGVVPDGSYAALAVGSPLAIGVVDAVLIDPERLLLGALAELTCWRANASASAIHLRLRPSSLVDPPLVLAAPLLLAEQSDAARRVAGRLRSVVAAV